MMKPNNSQLYTYEVDELTLPTRETMPPINPIPRLYLRIMWIHTLGHVGGGNRCGEDTL